MKMKKINANIKNTSMFVAVFFVMILLGSVGAKNICEKKRAHDFYKFLMNKVDSSAMAAVSNEGIDAFVRGYEKDSLFIEWYLKDLRCFSDAYEKDMKKSARLINQFDKTTSFESALKSLEEQNYNIGPNTVLFTNVKTKLLNAERAQQVMKTR